MQQIIVYIIILLSILNFHSKADDFISIMPESDTLFVGEKVQLSNNYTNSLISVYYTLDSGKTWNIITDDLSSSNEWILPFSLSRNIQFKIEKRTILPPKIIWTNTTAHAGEVRCIDISDNGRLVLTLGRDNYIKIWDIDQKSCIDSLEIAGGNYSYSAKFFHDNNKIIFTINDNSYIWDRVSKNTSTFYTLGDFVRSIDIHPTQNRFAVITNDCNLALFNESFFLPIPTFIRLYPTSDFSNFYGARYSKKGDRVGIATYQGKLIISKGQFGEIDFNLKVDNNIIRTLDFYDNDSKIAFGGASNQVKLLSLLDSGIIGLEPKFNSQIWEIRNNISRGDVIAASMDSTLKQWKLSNTTHIDVGLIKENFAILSMDLSSTGDTIALCGRNNKFSIWQNYSYLVESQVLSFEYRQKVLAKVLTNKSHYKPQENVVVSFDIISNFADTLQKLGSWDISSQIGLPYNYFYLENEDALKIDNGFIVFDTTNSFDFSKSELFKITGKSLYSSNLNDSVMIRNVTFEPMNNFYIVYENQKLQSDYFCYKSENPAININSAPIIHAVIDKIRSELIIKIKVFHKDKYKINVYDVSGKLIKQLNSMMLDPGTYELKISCNELTNSMYLIVLENSYLLKTIKTLIIE